MALIGPVCVGISGRIMLPGTATESFPFSEQKPASPNANSFRVNKGRASHRLHQSYQVTCGCASDSASEFVPWFVPQPPPLTVCVGFTEVLGLGSAITRSVLETLQHLNRLTSYGVGYRSFTEQYFDSCGIFKDAVIAIIATVAKQERVRISERVRSRLETARAKGKRLGRPRKIVDAAQVARLPASGPVVAENRKRVGRECRHGLCRWPCRVSADAERDRPRRHCVHIISKACLLPQSQNRTVEPHQIRLETIIARRPLGFSFLCRDVEQSVVSCFSRKVRQVLPQVVREPST